MKLALALSAVGSIVNRASAALVIFVSLREASLTLDSASLALFVVATYAPALFGLFDLGSSFALISPLTRAVTRDQPDHVRHLLTAAVVRITAGAVLGAVVMAAAFSYLSANNAPSATVSYSVVAGAGVCVLVLTTANLLLASLAQSFFVYQHYSLLTAFGNLTAVGLLLGGITSNFESNWFTLALLTILPPQLIALLAALPVLRRLRQHLAGWPTAKAPAAELAAEAHSFRAAAHIFFVLQAAGVVLGAVDPLLLKAHSHAAAATVLGVVLRVTQVLSTPFLLIANQLWPVYARLHAQGERRSIRRMLSLSMATFTLVAIAAAFGLNAYGVEILRLFAPSFNTQHPDAWTPSLGLAAALFLAANVLIAPMAAFMNGVNLLRPQLLASIAFIALALPLKLWFASSGSIDGMLISTAALLLGLNAFSLFGLSARQFKQAIGRI